MAIDIAADKYCFKAKDRMSALTHFIGFIISVFSCPIMIIKGAIDGRSFSGLISYAVFSMSMVLLYGASASYHSFNLGVYLNKRLRKIDHMMISVLIAGTYTPLCIGPLNGNGGYPLLCVIWALALLSIAFSLYWITCPKWLSSVIYIAMGWACVPYISKLYHILPREGFFLLLSGGIIYTIGGVLYAVKLRVLERNRNFRSHEVFHMFVMGGTLMHYLMVYLFIA